MHRAIPGAYVDDLPALDPLIAHEATENGWRGLTLNGDVLNVGGAAPPAEQSEFVIYRNGTPIGRRAVHADVVDINEYLTHFNAAAALYKANRCTEALAESNAAIAVAPTARARFNRSLILLSLGRWTEAWPDYEQRLELMTPPLIARVKQFGIPQWQGEDVRGKRLLLVHDAGFGDTVQNLRFIPRLRARGADIVLAMPPELSPLTRQLAPDWDDSAVDYFVPMLSLLHVLQVTPQSIPCARYLSADDHLQARWRWRVGIGGVRRRIGIAWSVGRTVEGDYSRAIPLAELVAALSGADIDLYSVQLQEKAQAETMGVRTFDYGNFGECAAVMGMMSAIVTIDTAAAHLAGAIGHPDVTVLLSSWASWRWHSNAFYPAFRLIQQTAPGDWQSALSQLAKS